MKKTLIIMFLLILGGIIYGTYLKNFIDFSKGERVIGFTVLFGTFVYLPLFLYNRWKGKSLKDYTINEENLKKMKRSDFK